MLRKNCKLINCHLIKVCLYDRVCCNYRLLMFNWLSSSFIVDCNLSISFCYLCNELLISLLSMCQPDTHECMETIKIAVYCELKIVNDRHWFLISFYLHIFNTVYSQKIE